MKSEADFIFFQKKYRWGHDLSSLITFLFEKSSAVQFDEI